MTIFEITDDRKLRIEFIGLQPGSPRPNSFSSQAVVFQKISDSTTLPANTRVEDFASVMKNQAIKARQSEAQQYISSINRNQITYRIEHSTFASSFDRLDLPVLKGAEEAETTNYSYKLVAADNYKTMVAAIPKLSELKSYVGIVYRYDNSVGKPVMNSVICESNKPTKTPPTPQLDLIPYERPNCPPGYVDLKSIMSPNIIKSVQGEAQTTMRAIVVNQMSYWEYRSTNSAFADSFDSLQFLEGEREAEREYYLYNLVVANTSLAIVTAAPKFDGLKSYVGIIYSSNDSLGKAVFYSVICESNKPTKKPPLPELIVPKPGARPPQEPPTCPSESSEL